MQLGYYFSVHIFYSCKLNWSSSSAFIQIKVLGACAYPVNLTTTILLLT